MHQIEGGCEQPFGATFRDLMFDARRSAQWVVAAGAGAAWSARRLLRTSAFYDEWTLVAQALHHSPWGAAWSSFNGHLWLLQDAVYRLQLLLGGVDVRWPVVTLQLLSCAALHVALACLAVRVGVPLAVGLLAGMAVVYMGYAAQNWLFVLQWAAVASMALAVAACAVVVGAASSRRRSAAVALLMIGAVLVESGSGTIGIVVVAVVVAMCWGRSAMVVVPPSALVLCAWYLWADLGPHFPSSWWQQVRFGAALLARSAGGLVGLGQVPGAVLCGVVGLGAVRVLWGGRASVVDRALVAGGGAGVLAAAAALARARAGLPGFEFADSNRYLFPVAVPLVIVALPLVRLVVERLAVDGRRRVSPMAAWTLVGALLVIGLSVGQRFEARWSRDFLAANDAVRTGVLSTAVLLRDGCPGGAAPDPDAHPVGGLSPQITVRLIAELMDRGMLNLGADPAADPTVVGTICP